MENRSTGVNEFLSELEHPLKDLILEVRSTIIKSNPNLKEHIKWNAPSYAINGEDRITMKLFPPKNIQVVFHTGAKSKKQPAERLIADPTGILKWVTNDRAVSTFITIEELELKASEFKKIINNWLEATAVVV
ncbi:DUF1801 domain-containing protein [Pontibacter vulgaris]|uniref:DUF1801 domain-containing protein n=1 Tax=Pontibacter vulgaris TaxID=2905679 RepID=UPI001FA73074|nr:DUF1801 domain-containing protein [Pontibacter vulgaris]